MGQMWVAGLGKRAKHKKTRSPDVQSGKRVDGLERLVKELSPARKSERISDRGGSLPVELTREPEKGKGERLLPSLTKEGGEAYRKGNWGTLFAGREVGAKWGEGQVF